MPHGREMPECYRGRARLSAVPKASPSGLKARREGARRKKSRMPALPVEERRDCVTTSGLNKKWTARYDSSREAAQECSPRRKPWVESGVQTGHIVYKTDRGHTLQFWSAQRRHAGYKGACLGK